MSTSTILRRLRRSPLPALVGALSVLLLLLGIVPSSAAGGAGGGGGGGGGGVLGGGGGGTAKPPVGAAAPIAEPTLSTPTFSVAPTGIHGFTDIGFLQQATVSGAECPGTPASNYGGTAVINNVTITVPCNMTVQMPANTFTWADFVNASPSLALDGGPYPSFELRVVGNIVGSSPTNGRHIAALMYFSQQSLNAGSGYITSIDYADGSFTVDPGSGSAPVRVQLNDPKITDPADPANGTGRFSAGQSPDPRLSVDQTNPTVTGATGYPMCIPRTDPKSADDPLCPQRNRPLVASGCRNFAQAGIPLPKSGELPAPPAGQVYCSAFVMPDPASLSGSDPDARQQMPFEVGDNVTFAGSLFKDAAGGTYISAHTVRANVGAFTQPGTQPSYLSIEGSLIGSADPQLTAVTGVTQEPRDRLVVEADTTDIESAVDVYLPDIDPQSGAVRSRWVTPQAMTSEFNFFVGGGITTQFNGPQPQRARLRANKAPAGLLSNPGRTIRVSDRDACQPSDPQGHNFGTPDYATNPSRPGDVDACFQQLPLVANGLKAGMYTAPMFNFVFPENVEPGDPVVPFDLWHLGFLRYGEGPNPITPATGPLQPTPW